MYSVNTIQLYVMCGCCFFSFVSFAAFLSIYTHCSLSYAFATTLLPICVHFSFFKKKKQHSNIIFTCLFLCVRYRNWNSLRSNNTLYTLEWCDWIWLKTLLCNLRFTWISNLILSVFSLAMQCIMISLAFILSKLSLFQLNEWEMNSERAKKKNRN